jgi:hypothetical protein
LSRSISARSSKSIGQSIDLLRERIDVRGGVIYFDISDLDIDGYNKFIPYMLYPAARYTVSVLSSPTRAKISIGSNPWNPDAAEDNLASLAEQYGGGGHPRVAAISLDPHDIARAKQRSPRKSRQNCGIKCGASCEPRVHRVDSGSLKKPPNPRSVHSERSEESLFLCVEPNLGEIPRSARNVHLGMTGAKIFQQARHRLKNCPSHGKIKSSWTGSSMVEQLTLKNILAYYAHRKHRA